MEIPSPRLTSVPSPAGRPPHPEPAWLAAVGRAFDRLTDFYERTLDWVRASPIPVDTLLITHHHADHVGGVVALRDAPLMPNQTTLTNDFVQTVANIATLRPVPQSTDDVSHADKLEKADAEIVWSHPAISIDRRIRGCTPEPGAWSSIMGDRIEIGPVGLRPDVTELAAGAFSIGKQVLAGTGSHAVELRQVKPAGKGWMAADAWARGLRTVPERFDAR